MQLKPPVLALALMLLLQACGGKPSTPTQITTSTQTSTPSLHSPGKDGAPVMAPSPGLQHDTPLTITSMAIPEGKPFGDEWTMVPYGKFQVVVTAPGAEEVTLALYRYPSSPDVPERKPDAQEGDRYIFHVDIAGSAHYQVAYATAKKGDKIVVERRQLFALKPEHQKFTTVAKGAVSGWPADKDAEVSELFKEGQVYGFETPAKYQAFSDRLKRLVGIALPEVDLQGRTVVVIVGAPTEGARPFEAVQVEWDPNQPPKFLRILMEYSATPTAVGVRSAAYHVLLIESRDYKPLGSLTVNLLDSPFARPFATGVVLVPSPIPAQAKERVYSATTRGRIVHETSSGQLKLIKPNGSSVTLGKGAYGQLDAEGNALFGDWQTGLHRYNVQTEKVEQIRPPGRVGAPFFIDSTGRYLVHQSFSDGENEDMEHFKTSIVVVIDLLTGQEQPLYGKKGQYAHVWMWVGNRALVQSWEDGPANYNVFKLVDLQGREDRLRALEKAPLATEWPLASPDQQHMVYKYKQGYVLVHPASQRFQLFEGAENAYWANDGLVLVQQGIERKVDPVTGAPL